MLAFLFSITQYSKNHVTEVNAKKVIWAISYFSPVTENVKKTFVNCNDLKEKASNQ